MLPLRTLRFGLISISSCDCSSETLPTRSDLENILQHLLNGIKDEATINRQERLMRRKIVRNMGDDREKESHCLMLRPKDEGRYPEHVLVMFHDWHDMDL